MKFNLLLLLACLVNGCGPTTSADSHPQSIEQENQKEENTMLGNRELVQQFFSDVSQGKISEAFELVDDEVKWWVPGDLPFSGTKNKVEYMGIVSAITNGFPSGFKLTVKSMISEGSKIAAEVESSGNHVSGKEYRNKYHFLITIDGGKMVAVKEYMDTLHLFQLIAN